MHEFSIFPPQGTTARKRQPNQIESQVSNEAPTRPHTEPIRSEPNVNSVLLADINTVPAPISSPAPEAASETSKQPTFSK